MIEEKSQKFIRLPMFELTDSAEFDFNRQMQLIAARYAAEDRLLSAVASGDEEAVFSAYRAYGELMQEPEQKNADTSDDPLRDFKNSVLITNTLFRKAIEGSSVHPIYIHESSSYFGRAIEAAESMEDLYVLIWIWYMFTAISSRSAHWPPTRRLYAKRCSIST